MCLAIPGCIAEISGTDRWERTGRVAFGPVFREVNLSCVPDAGVGDYVLVHAGFAISVLDKAEAERTIAYLDELEEEGP